MLMVRQLLESSRISNDIYLLSYNFMYCLIFYSKHILLMYSERNDNITFTSKKQFNFNVLQSAISNILKISETSRKSNNREGPVKYFGIVIQQNTNWPLKRCCQ